ncbi:hypothetical protein Tco_1320857 [Tanacetum coccineum]
MVNVIPLGHVDDVPVVETNQHDDVPVVLEPVLEDEDEDPKEEEFKEEEEPQEEEDDMEVGEHVTAPVLRTAEVDGILLCIMSEGTLTYLLLVGDLGNEVRSSVEQGTTAIEKLVEKLGNAEDKVECKKLKKELKRSKVFSDTYSYFADNEQVERDLYWTRVRAHEFYQEMIRRGFVFEERPNEAINVPIKDEKSPSSESRGSPHDS